MLACGRAEPVELIVDLGVLTGCQAPCHLPEQREDPGEDGGVGAPVAAWLGNCQVDQFAEGGTAEHDAQHPTVVVQQSGAEVLSASSHSTAAE